MTQHVNNLDESDPQLSAIQTTIPKLAACLGADFKPFLPPIMESLFKNAKRDLDFKVTDAPIAGVDEDDEEDATNPIQTLLLQVKGMEGSKQIQMNTHALEAKINAVEHIGSVAQALGSNFFEYVEPVS